MLGNLRLKLIRARKGGTAAARSVGVTVGEACRIQTLHFGSEPWLVTIGDRVTVATDVQFLTHDGVGWLHRDDRGRRYRYAPVSVGDDCFIGWGSIIMPGVKIGNRCVVGAGSVVTKSVPDGTVVAGSPARIITTYDDLMARVDGWVTEQDLRGLTGRERVARATDAGFLPELQPRVPKA